jgi:hypothetical protein
MSLENKASKISNQKLYTLVCQAFLSVLAFFIAAEALSRIIVHLLNPPVSYHKSFDYKFDIASHAPKLNHPEIFIFGDSRMDNGIYADYLERKLKQAGYDLQVINLATPGQALDMSQLLLETAIKAGHKPNLVIINAQIGNFQPAEHGNLLTKTYMGNCIVANQSQHPDETFDCFIRKHLFFYRYRTLLKEFLSKLPDYLSSEESPYTYSSNTTYYSPRGWQPLLAITADRQKIYTPELPQPFDYSMYSFQSEVSFSRFYQLCKNKKIRILMIQLPEYGTSDHKAFFRRAEQYYGIRYLNLHDSLRDDSTYYDSVHLNAAGAIHATEMLVPAVIQMERKSQFKTTLY